MFNVATDLKTRQIIWVLTVPGKGQANSHTRPNRMDGAQASEIAGLYASHYGEQG